MSSVEAVSSVPVPLCTTKGCTREARVAIKTSRPTRAELKTTIWYDDRSAPKTAIRYCKQCGGQVLSDLMVVVHDDSETTEREAVTSG